MQEMIFKEKIKVVYENIINKLIKYRDANLMKNYTDAEFNKIISIKKVINIWAIRQNVKNRNDAILLICLFDELSTTVKLTASYDIFMKNIIYEIDEFNKLQNNKLLFEIIFVANMQMKPGIYKRFNETANINKSIRSIKFIQIDELVIIAPEHNLSTPYKIVSPQDINIEFPDGQKFPKIETNDIMAKWYGLEKNDIIETIIDSRSTGRQIQYRIVVESTKDAKGDENEDD